MHWKVQYSCIVKSRPPMPLHLHNILASKFAHSQAAKGFVRLIPDCSDTSMAMPECVKNVVQQNKTDRPH